MEVQKLREKKTNIDWGKTKLNLGKFIYMCKLTGMQQHFSQLIDNKHLDAAHRESASFWQRATKDEAISFMTETQGGRFQGRTEGLL